LSREHQTPSFRALAARALLHSLSSGTMRASALLALMGTAHAAIELTPDNFDTMVFDSGKAAFVKFLAPW